MTALGGWIWLGARVVYLPLYASGVPRDTARVVWTISMVGLAHGDLAAAVRLRRAGGGHKVGVRWGFTTRPVATAGELSRGERG